ncbi:hypothetical protein E3N88_44978 [Mikania micrantha]|uniref:Mediator complex subunit 15 KIX domain-containing protein n=1 Tax=Mikania micrantha TaxID=192012 RepID=A0A5N6LAI2_9ASTR|nr:hypothetical protein E3N88_44978 [Mikania micrantha]
MDMRNWRHANGTVGNLTMECGDWRAQLQRQRSVNKLMDILTRHLPFSGYERLQELKKIAVRVEEEIYTVSTSQSEYSRKICLNMLMIETRLQNPMSYSLQSNSPSFSVPLDLTAQAGNPNGGDWQEEVYQKVKAMKELYLLDLRPTQGASGLEAIGDHVMQPGDWRAQLSAASRERIRNRITDTLKRHLPFSRHERLHELEKIAETVEEKIYTTATCQSEYSRKLCFMMLTMESRSQNFMSDTMRSNSGALYSSVNSSVPLDSTSQTGNQNGGNWQEEVYKKIKAMKDLYLLDLNDLHQRVVSKLQQHDLPQQLENEQLEKLKIFKNMLERYMQLLQIPKHGIIAIIKDKLGSYEKQIIHVINLSRRRRVNPQQQPQAQALPPPHMQSLQQSEQAYFQLTQVQSHENQINLQGSMASMHPNNTGNMQLNTSASLSGVQMLNRT